MAVHLDNISGHSANLMLIVFSECLLAYQDSLAQMYCKQACISLLQTYNLAVYFSQFHPQCDLCRHNYFQNGCL